ncbi:hypothetical protein INS49_001689 [Diaporthe citri]|uniref:uncharacterized protein n=1 Tax=Diaporthe citri TaxID=83186 RepID=UPI001C7FABB8|nr:uncharacterized protein INS49_001689 [Diaporthe citri]KAG6367499.1 hypothetical protein INS49_001689 [Diaporthe citri]
MGRPEEHTSDAEILPLPMSSGAFEKIQSTWSFPSELLRMMLSTMPLATEFETESHIGSVSGLLQGLQEHEAQRLLSSLQKSIDVAEDPLLVALILFEMKIHFFALLLENRARGLEDLEESTGMTHFNTQSKETDEERAKKLKRLSFSDITQKLTGIAGTLAFCEMTFESCLQGMLVATEWRNKIINHSTKAENGCRWNACASIDRRVAYIKSLAAGARAHGRVLEARRAAQVQTVKSSNINPSRQICRGDSHRIAEISYQDNAAMKTIALLARRDSTDMRIVAWATLIFLPGTFTATLFSSTFFDFLPDDNNPRIVSWWIWLYCLVTVLITGLVLIGWYHFSRRSRAKTQDGMEKLKSSDGLDKFGTRGA